MKKNTQLLILVAAIVMVVGSLALYFTLTLNGEERESVANVIEEIDSIGEVALESDQRIYDARTDYEGLSNKEKHHVTNLDRLVEAEETLSKLQVQNVEAMIDAIGTVTEESNDVITAAEEAYNRLTDQQKQQVSNFYSGLNMARDDFDRLAWEKKSEELTRELRQIIRVSQYSVDGPNESGFFDISLSITNNSSKTAETIIIWLSPGFIDGVENVAPERSASKGLVFTGPYASGETESMWAKGIWEGTDIEDIYIERIEITYSDGSTNKVDGSDLKEVIY